jgi:cytosine deaminase
MDATLSYGLPRVNASGTLLEGIALWGELKPQLTHEALVERALRYCDWAVAQGCWRSARTSTCATRGCWRCEALLQVQAPRRALPRPAAGGLSAGRRAAQPGALANLVRALDLGVDVVGGIPHFERTMADGAESVRCCASWPPSAACAWTCTATRATTRCRATSRRWPSTPSAWGCRAG